MRKRRFAVTIVGSALLALGVTSGVILAQDGGTEDAPPQVQTEPAAEESQKKAFAGRVAEILGLPAAEVEDAFAQAKLQIGNERATDMLDRLVADGRLTQEEADEALAWFEARPEGLPDGLPFGKHGARGPQGHGPKMGHGGMPFGGGGIPFGGQMEGRPGLPLDGEIREFLENSPLDGLLQDGIDFQIGDDSFRMRFRGGFPGPQGQDMRGMIDDLLGQWQDQLGVDDGEEDDEPAADPISLTGLPVS